jgi:hypothetical protein
METPIILTKSPVEALPVTLDLTNRLLTGETVIAASVGLITPAGITITDITVASPDFSFYLRGGADGVSYGARLDITVSNLDVGTRVFSLQLAVLVSSQIGNSYTIRNPEGIQTLIDTVQAGDMAIGNVTFTFPDGTDLNGGSIFWELLDVDGVTYANGNAFEYIVSNIAIGIKVDGRGIITIPSDVPINIDGYKYQVRWTLTLANGTQAFSYENVRVVSLNTVPEGPEDTVEMWGDIAQVSIVLPKFYDHVGIEVYGRPGIGVLNRTGFTNPLHSGSVKIIDYTEVSERIKTPDGYLCSAYVDTSVLDGGYPIFDSFLESSVVIWKYWNDARPSSIFRETARLFVVNASILSVTDDLRTLINRSHATIAHKQDILFTVPILLAFLRMGRDAFNGAYGVLTNFNMSNATGGIRQFWIWYSAIEALRSQYLAEGEKVFNFSGQAISLDIDRTSYYETLASSIQSRMDNECKPFKQNLIKKGIVSGDGNLDNIGLRIGAIGSIGINISPASNFSRFMGKYGGTQRIG